MQELDDNALLREYVERDSEEAFATLVTRHINKVYSVALRHTRNSHQAEEITQAVFVILAKKSHYLGKGVVLSGWLYQTSRLTAVTFIRSEIRRARREQEAYMQTVLNENESDVWPQIAPLLDAAMAGLSAADRHAVVLRYFDGKSMKEVGTALDVSEDAAKMRLNRAVEKLRGFFTKRGVVLPAAVLTTAISANSVQAAPAVLAKSITVVAIAKGAAASGSTLTLIKGALKVMAWTKAKTAVVAGMVLILAAGTTTVIVKKSGYYSRVESFQQESIARLNLSKQWALAFIRYAGDHGNQLPDRVSLVKAYFPNLGSIDKKLLWSPSDALKSHLKKDGSTDPNWNINWVIVSGGNLNSFTNPSQTILIRETEAWQSPDGKFVKVYAFADGHAELISSPDDDFAALEKQRGFLVQPAKN
jgi:RNA polymerase sigma factor (sigma-70 family)